MERRIIPIVAFFAFALVGALVRVFYMQVIKSGEFSGQAETNYLRRIPIPPIRGRILDRNGVVLASWEPRFMAVAMLEDTSLTENEVEKLRVTIGAESLSVKKSYLGYTVLARDIPYDKALAVLERSESFGWLLMLPWFTRTYPHSGPVSPVVGYVGADGVGKAGIESALNDQLMGAPGTKYLMVDARGRVIKKDIYPEEVPLQGKDITISIDSRLQEAADTLFRGYRSGAAVVINIKTGEILVLYTKPYVSSWTMAYGTPEEKAEALSAPGSPLLNRAVAGMYPPGSTFKPVVAMAGLASGAITPNSVFCCAGGMQMGTRFFKCTGFHGCLDLVHGIEHSCNTYFYSVGTRMGLPTLLYQIERFGFLKRRYDLGVGGEKPALVPSLNYYKKHFGKQLGGVTLNLSIGQGELLLTPVHMALIAALVARGETPLPHIIVKVGEENYVPPETLRIPLSEKDREAIKRGMLLVVESGTAKTCRLPGFKFGGKTGTAQTPRGQDHSLFIFYAPYDNPEIAGAVVVEHGGFGAAAAAPVARELIRRYFGLPPAPLFGVKKKHTETEEPEEIE
ncbi:MAG: penicillin-binding transpeptidase domain-containing protein [candidate division WOR-3 bacterium]